MRDYFIILEAVQTYLSLGGQGQVELAPTLTFIYVLNRINYGTFFTFYNISFTSFLQNLKTIHLLIQDLEVIQVKHV